MSTPNPQPAPKTRPAQLAPWLAFAATTSVLLALFAWHANTRLDEALKDEREHLQTYTQLVAQQMAYRLEQEVAVLKVTREVVQRQLRSGAALQELMPTFGAYAKVNPNNTVLTYVNASGTVVLASDPRLIGLDVTDNGAFAFTKAQSDANALIIAPPRQGALGHFVPPLSMLVHDDKGRFQGYVTSVINILRYPQWLQVDYLPGGTQAGLVHINGQMLFSSNPDVKVHEINLSQLPNSLFNQHRESGRKASFFDEVQAITQQRRLVATHDIYAASTPTVGGFNIAASRPRDMVLAAEWGEIQREMVGLAFGMLAGVFLMHLYLRQRAQALHSAQARLLSGLVANSSDPILSKDHNDTITSWNAAAQRLFGYSPEEIVGQPITKLIAPERQDEEARISAQVALGQRMEPFETERLHKDGQAIAVQVSVSPMLDEHGRMVGTSKIFRDIREQKRARQALRLAQTMVEQSADAIIATDCDGYILAWNTGAQRLYGHSAEEALGQSVSILYPENNRLDLATVLQAVRSGQIVLQKEVDRQRKDGRRVAVALNFAPLKDDAGHLIGVVSSASDITERKALQAQNQQQLDILATAPFFIGTARLSDQIITYVNPEGLRMSCLPLDDSYIGMPISSLHPPWTMQMLREVALPEALREGHWRGQTALLGPDGQAFPVDHTILVHKDLNGEPEWVSAIMRDIRVEVAAQSRNQQLLDIIEQSPEFFGTATVQGEPIFINDSGRKLFGLPAHGPAGISVIDFYAEHERERVQSEVLPQVMQTGLWEGEIDMKTRTGEVFPSHEVLLLHRDASGVPSHMSNIIRDIRAQRTYEQALVVARDAAQAGMKAKSDFLSFMSHELRTPLNGVLGMLQVLEFKNPRPEQATLIKTALASGQHLVHIINDILDLSRIEAQGLTLEQAPFSLQGVFEQVATTLRPLNQKDLDLAVEVDNPVNQPLIGDASRLLQVLLNLGGNAIKFTEHGQVKISATMLSATPTNARIQFSVRDTGIGISTLALEQLFKPFAQADNSMTRRFGGTGLGLAISGQLVTLMGGRIQVESSPGQGSHFWFELELPFERRQAERIATDALLAREASKLEGKLAGLRVLVAEDHRVNQQIVKLMLEDAGAEVSVADNGQQAVEAVQLAAKTDRPVDLILMDMNMPVMMGVEATRRLRELGYAKPVFGLSANVMQSHLQECLDAGMNGLIGKPFIREDLVHTIAQACQRSDAV